MRHLRKFIPVKRVLAAFLLFFAYITFRGRETAVYALISQLTFGLLTTYSLTLMLIVHGLYTWIMPLDKRWLLVYIIPLLVINFALALLAFNGYPQVFSTIVLLLFLGLYGVAYCLERWSPSD